MARSTLTFGRHPDDENHYVIASNKHNLSCAEDSLIYRIDVVDALDDDGNPCQTTKVIIEGIADGITADDLAMTQPCDPEERAVAVDWLKDFLADGEWHSPAEASKAARKDGVGCPRTIRRAAARLRVEKDSFGFPAVMHWRLAPERTLRPQNGHGSESDRSVSALSEQGEPLLGSLVVIKPSPSPSHDSTKNREHEASADHGPTSSPLDDWDGKIHSRGDEDRAFDYAASIGLTDPNSPIVPSDMFPKSEVEPLSLLREVH